ncbi:transcription antitermination factor NusB [Kangiella profundi]|uniref:Transcription antitermination protein NusB n=1 Tax=Kangiella profundi TaxID=1561924 RepID=A0A2K9ASG2_9GAMM|nr:transcription antitermination factor NusB [Kangiella profundi]AUD78101.1 transcription antitermination factor NusB [Kangiella profundi]MBD3667454.1 transcription antitermination factor NusB [Kangiella sp.]GGF05052.1 N utilization substance protein B [Kangiella profundi]
MSTTFKPAARRRAREYAIQAIYQWQMSSNPLNEIEAQYLTTMNAKKVDTVYFQELFSGVLTNLDEIDAALAPALERDIDDIDPIERAIIRLSAFELKKRIDVPKKVVINEGIELAKTFGATDGHKFVNGVLDKISKDLRPHE